MVQATAMNSALQEGQSIVAPGIPSHLRPKVHRLVDCHLGFSEGWPKSNLKELDGKGCFPGCSTVAGAHNASLYLAVSVLEV